MASYPSEKEKEKQIPDSGIDIRTVKEGDNTVDLNELIVGLENNDDIIDEFELRRVEKIINDLKKHIEIEYDADVSYENFMNNILPDASQQMDDLDKLKTDAEHKLLLNNKKLCKRLIPKRVALYVASIVILLMATNFVSIVFAERSLFAPIIQWSTELFNTNVKRRTSNPIILGDGMKTFSDYKFVEQYYSISILSPEYIPMGFELEDLLVVENKEKDFVSARARYSDQKESYAVTIKKIDNVDSGIDAYSEYIEKNPIIVQKIESSNISYYIFENEGWPAVFWTYKEFTYNLYGTLPIDELIEIISSINTTI